MKRVLCPALLAVALGLSGCARDNSLSQNPLLQNAARGVLTAKNYDEALVAIRNGDTELIAAELKDLDSSSGIPNLSALKLSTAQLLVRDASVLDITAQTLKGQERKNQQQHATRKYRLAQQLAPTFNSSDPRLLNALGYFLAERGTSTQDFQTGERLARRSLKMWNKLVKEAEGSFLPGADRLAAERRFMRANVRDSVAWALYRQKKYAAALKEQTEAVREAEISTAQIGEKVPDELYEHLQIIQQAAGQKPEPQTGPEPEVEPKVEPKVEPEPDERKVARRIELKNE